MVYGEWSGSRYCKAYQSTACVSENPPVICKLRVKLMSTEEGLDGIQIARRQTPGWPESECAIYEQW